jgi:uncharacterized protein YceH (UPF0502 family)
VDALELTPEELRVLGSLVEKELTTPEQYPLTLNALVLACNQRSNREPVVNLGEETVLSAVTSAKTKSLVRFVHPSHGRSALRYAHTLADALDVSQRQLALLAVMILRGSQTLNELRIRTGRMAEFSDLNDLERELSRLSGLETPLVERQARRPGQKEDRYAHLLGSEAAGGSTDWNEPPRAEWARPAPREPRSSERRSVEPLSSEVGSAEMANLAQQVEQMREEISQLRTELSDLRSQLGD